MQKRHFTQNKAFIRACGAVCCMICMLFMLVTGTENAYAQNSAEIVAISSTAEKGGTAKIALNIANNPGIWGLTFKVGYDHNAMTLQAVEVGNVFATEEVTLPDSLDKDYFVFYGTANALANISTNGTLVVLEFKISDTATSSDYAISLEMTQCINVEDEDVTLSMTNGKVTVVDCLHSQKEWRVTDNPECEQKGTETEFCKKCNHAFGTRDVEATGHKNTELINVATATKEKEGYTGDTYCNDCKKVIKEGTAIPKVEKPQDTEEKAPETGQPDSPVVAVVIVLMVAILVDVIFMQSKVIKKGR